MWISEIVERTIIQTMASLDVTFRASRVDDAPSCPTERQKYPCMTIVAAGGNTTTIESLFDIVECMVEITTHYKDDPKGTTLAALSDEFRTILDQPLATTTIQPAFNAIALAAGEERYFSGLTEIEGGMPDKSESKQTITTMMKFHICGAVST
jgi:hypothetical protein